VITSDGETYPEVEQTFRNSIDDLTFYAESGEPPDRTLIGARLPPELHRQATALAGGMSTIANPAITRIWR
jgi:predicted HicB family RNase H-like nuclease